MQRLGLVRTSLFFVVLLTTNAVAASAFASTPDDPGFHVVTVNRAGFSIEIPDTWVEIDFTKKQADELLRGLRADLPHVAARLPGDASEYLRQNVKLVALDAAPGDLHGNVNAMWGSARR